MLALFAMISIGGCKGGEGADFGTFRIERVDLEVAQPGKDYSVYLDGKGGMAPYIDWKVIEGQLPIGLHLSDDGRISGNTQGDPGLYFFIVEAIDSDLQPNTDDELFAIRVGDPTQDGPLLTKANAYEEFLQERHVPDGLILNLTNPDAALTDRVWDGYEQSARMTGLYLATAAYRWVLTETNSDLDVIRTTVKAIDRLRQVTGQKGLVANGMANDSVQLLCCDDLEEPDCEQENLCGGENFPDYHAGTGEFAGWHWIGDPGKADYSGLIFGLSTIAALVEDQEILTLCADILGEIVTALIENDFTITDIDGKATTDGDLNAFAEDDADQPTQGLNALIALAWVQAAYLATEDQSYKDQYFNLLEQKDYLSAMDEDFPVYRGYKTDWNTVALAFESFAILIDLETSDRRLSAYRTRMTERLWTADGEDLDDRRAEAESSPLYNLLWSQANERFDPAIRLATHLELAAFDDAPRLNRAMDLTGDSEIEKNPDKEGWSTEALSVALRPPAPYIWTENPYLLTGGADDGRAFPGLDFLLPYWMGRFTERLGPNL